MYIYIHILLFANCIEEISACWDCKSKKAKKKINKNKKYVELCTHVYLYICKYIGVDYISCLHM